MNVFYRFLYLICLILFSFDLLEPRFIRHMAMIVDEELVNNNEFSHTVKSDNGKSEEKFFINRVPVMKDEYYKELEEAQLGEMRRERERLERQKRSRIGFANQAQVAIMQKMVARLTHDIARTLDLLQHDQLKKYYVFDSYSIESMDQLAYIKHYIEHKVQGEVQELAALMDMQSLQEVVDKLESWPDKLEACFKDSVQNAIKESDDTAALKELLSLVAYEM